MMMEFPTGPSNLTTPSWSVNPADGDLRPSTSAPLASAEAPSSVAGQPLLFMTGQFAGQVSRRFVSHWITPAHSYGGADDPHGAP